MDAVLRSNTCPAVSCCAVLCCMQPGRNLTIEMLTSLRLMCIELLHVLMVWEPFRTLQEPVSVACRGRGMMAVCEQSGACVLMVCVCLCVCGGGGA
jgi:hypothetical protein